MTYSIPPEALDRYDFMLSQGRIISGAWTREEGGRHLACVLAALSPEVAEQGTADACPGNWMPGWLAHRIVQVDDKGTAKVRAASLRRLSPILRGLSRIPTTDLDPGGIMERRDRARAVSLALATVTEDRWGVRDACAKVLRLLEHGGTPEERAAAWDAAGDARIAAKGANVATGAAGATIWGAAGNAAWVAARAVENAAWATIRGAARNTRTAAWDHLNTGLLSDLEAVIAGRDVGPFPHPDHYAPAAALRGATT